MPCRAPFRGGSLVPPGCSGYRRARAMPHGCFAAVNTSRSTFGLTKRDTLDAYVNGTAANRPATCGAVTLLCTLPPGLPPTHRNRSSTAQKGTTRRSSVVTLGEASRILPVPSPPGSNRLSPRRRSGDMTSSNPSDVAPAARRSPETAARGPRRHASGNRTAKAKVVTKADTDAGAAERKVANQGGYGRRCLSSAAVAAKGKPPPPSFFSAYRAKSVFLLRPLFSFRLAMKEVDDDQQCGSAKINSHSSVLPAASKMDDGARRRREGGKEGWRE